MREACNLIWTALVGLFRSRASLAAETLVLRHQINILRRHSSKRQTFRTADRLIFAGLYRLAPTVLNALTIVKPDTVIKWHRAGFRSYWRWKSRRRGGRPTVVPEIRKLIREMSIANPLWGAPRIHGELLKLGIGVGETSVAKYILLYVAEVGDREVTGGKNNARLRCIFENGTESDMLLRSLAAELYKDGRRVLAHEDRLLDGFDGISDEDQETGYIYIF